MDGWNQRYRTEIAEKDQEIESLKQQLMIKFKEEYEEEEVGRARTRLSREHLPEDQLKSSLQIRPNQIMLPFVPKEAETDDMYGEGVDEIEGLGNQAGIPEYDLFMQNMRRGSQNPRSGSIKHHPPHIQKLILGIGKRIRA